MDQRGKQTVLKVLAKLLGEVVEHVEHELDC